MPAFGEIKVTVRGRKRKRQPNIHPYNLPPIKRREKVSTIRWKGFRHSTTRIEESTERRSMRLNADSPIRNPDRRLRRIDAYYTPQGLKIWRRGYPVQDHTEMNSEEYRTGLNHFVQREGTRRKR